MNRRMLTLCCFCLIGLTSRSQNQPLFLNLEPDTFPPDRTHIIADTIGLRVQMGLSRTQISPYGLVLRLDSMLSGHYPIIMIPPERHQDHVPFLFNMNSTEQPPYTGQNNVLMFGWNLGLGGTNFIAGKPAIGFSLESNYHPGGDSNTTWVESHEIYMKPSGQQVRLKSYTVGVPPGSEFIDLYHTTDNFHLRSENQIDYFTIHRNRSTGDAVMGFESSGETSMLIGRTDQPQSLQFLVGTDRVSIVGQSKIIDIPAGKEFYFNSAAIGGVNTGYGLNIGSGINAVGEMGGRQVQYQFFTNNTGDSVMNGSAIMSVGTYSTLFGNIQYGLVAYNNGVITVNKGWQQFSGKASMEIGRKNNTKTPLKLDDLPTYPSAAAAIADGLEPGCLYIREGHGLDVIVAPNPTPRTVEQPGEDNERGI